MKTDYKFHILNLFDNYDLTEISVRLQNSISSLLVSLFDIASTAVSPGQSTEHHKEPEDKRALTKLLVQMSLRPSSPTPLVYADEVIFDPRCSGPHGTFDQLIGHKSSDEFDNESDTPPVDSAVIVTHGGDWDCTGLTEVCLAESKSVLGNKPNRIHVQDGDHTVQPTVQLLAVSQLEGFKMSEPSLLFFGTRTHIRPYIYYQSCDILLTFPEAFQWKNEQKLDILGTTIVGLLMRTGDVTQFRDRDVVGEFLHNRKFPSTGFVQAMHDAQASLENAILKTMKVPTELKDDDSRKTHKSPSKHDEEDLMREYEELEALKKKRKEGN